MDDITVCAVCSNRLVRRPGRGRRPRFCSDQCRDDARNEGKRERRMFSYIQRHYSELGEEAVRARLDADADFREQAITTVEHYMAEPIGQGVTSNAADVVSLLYGNERRFSVISHDTPLPSNADIDAAEASGDWSAMAKQALRDMAWPLANGFKPDLTEFPVSDTAPKTL